MGLLEGDMATSKTCIIYHYFEAQDLYRKNFLHFLSFGTQVDADIFCVISGNYTVKLPKIPQVTYVFTINHNYDYGAYAFALENAINTHAYQHFIFINATVRGPYIPPYSNASWTEAFIEPLSDRVGLVGTTINILPRDTLKSIQFQKKYGGKPPFSHIQTMAYALTKKSLQFLMDEKFFDTTLSLNRNELISRYEIYLTQLLIDEGYQIHCLLPEYNNAHVRSLLQDINPSSIDGEPCYEDAYMGRSIHPFEVIFIKANRKIWPEYYLDMLSYSMWASKKYKYNFMPNLSIADNLKAKRKQELIYKAKSLFKAIKYFIHN
jgi:hypothetical protein